MLALLWLILLWSSVLTYLAPAVLVLALGLGLVVARDRGFLG